MLNPDFRDILSAFNEEKVEYLVVGAYALAAHGFVRARHLTPLSEVQKEILKRAELKPSLYKYLEINKSPPQLTEW